jgi:hypothetical protein
VMLMLSRFGLTLGRQRQQLLPLLRPQGILPTAHSWVDEMRRLRASEKYLIALSLTNTPIDSRCGRPLAGTAQGRVTRDAEHPQKQRHSRR